MAFTFARPAHGPVPRFASIALPYGRARRKPDRSRAGADRTAWGVLAILAGTVAFPLSDLAAQSLTQSLPALEVAWLRYIVFLMAVLPLLMRGTGALRTARPGLQVLRGTMSACSTIAAIVSFKFLPVAESTAIGFIAPVVVTALAMMVLGEKVGLRRWGAALAAFVGVMVIVQPGGASFRPAALIPLAGAVASAVAVIGTRLSKNDAPGTTMLYSALVGTVILSGLVAFDWTTPSAAELQVALLVGGFGALGTLMQVIAYRLAPASLLAPFTSMQLIWAGGLSFLFVGAVPTAGMLAGSAIIGASAIYTGYRERVKGIA